MRQYLKNSVGKGSALGKVLKFCFGESFHFFLDKKVEQKNQVLANAPPPGRLTHLWQVEHRSYCLGMVDEWDKWARLRCVLCEDTGGAMFRPGFLKAISVLKNGGTRRWKISDIMVREDTSHGVGYLIEMSSNASQATSPSTGFL